MAKSNKSGVTIVLDNGGGTLKAGFAGEKEPALITPNCLVKPPSSKKAVHFSQTTDLTSALVRRPIDRGYLTNPDLQRDIWAHTFETLKINPQTSSLLLTEPLFALPAIQRLTDQLLFEDFGFNAVTLADPARLVHLYEASRRNGLSQCSLVVDCGFSFTHVVPVLEGFVLRNAVKRVDLGGKALTNHLKELVSYRAVNVMDEWFLMDDVKENLCFLSLDLQRDLNVARKPGRDNLFRCTYVLPDGITHTKGFVKNPDEAKRYLGLTDANTCPSAVANNKHPQEAPESREERRKADLTKNEFDLTNERFLVPEMLFQPVDLGINQAGLAECIVRAVNSCHPYLHPVLYESIILTGGSTLFPRFAERLERDLRPLVPDEYQVKIKAQEDPIVGVWRGGSLLASSPDFETMCVTKAEYEELGSDRCRKRFFH